MQIDLKLFLNGKNHDYILDIDEEDLKDWLLTQWLKWIQIRTRREMRKGLSPQVAAISAMNSFNINDLAEVPVDEVEEEAINLAVEEIAAKLAGDYLPVPKNIRDHALIAVQSNDKYYERAKARLSARAEVVRETLGRT